MEVRGMPIREPGEQTSDRMEPTHALSGCTAAFDSPLTHENCPQRVARFVDSIPDYPNSRFAGRGIVICAGGIRLLTNAWVCIRVLRARGCKLPVQVWYLGEGEFDEDWEALVQPYDVEMVDAIKVRDLHPHRRLAGWELKTFAMLHCPFKEIILLDADNVTLINPAEIFAWPEYIDRGTIFWPDYGKMERSRPLWRDLRVAYRDEYEVESGQVVADKERSWQALLVANWINEHSDFFYQFMHGDKNAFQFGWYRTATPFAMPPHEIRTLEGTMGQHDFRGRLVFLHRNNLKWDLSQSPRSSGFVGEDECYAFLDELREKWCVSLKFAGRLSGDERAAMKDLAARKYVYHRVGHDSRSMTFNRNGLIVEGSQECERYFYCRYNDVVLLDGNGKITCELQRQRDNCFYGRWQQYEKMPIVLEEVR